MSSACLLITCEDQPGLVAAVATFVHRHGGNILHADQHTDEDEGIFFQRVEWSLDHFKIERDQLGETFEREVAIPHRMRWSLHFSDTPRRVGIMVSKASHCLYDLLARYKASDFTADIPAILSNHQELESVASQFNVPYFYIPVTADTKHVQEQEVLRVLSEQRIELLVLARYMQVLSGEFLQTFGRPIINIHHSFLPAFAGAKPYHRAYRRGVKIIGATAHYVTADLDEGPIIEQDVARVTHRDTVEKMMAKGRDLEKIVLARALKLHLDNAVLVYKNKTVVFDGT